MSLSAAPDVPLAAAAPTVLTPEVVCSWGAPRVKQWAMTVKGITEVFANILVAQEIDGAALLDVVTEDKLRADGMPRGPAGKLMNAVAAIKKAGGTAPTDGGAGAGAGACG
jgi:hypothetical protein